MQKKLTILFAFAIFVLVVGLSITPAQAHTKGTVCTDDPMHKHCNGDPPPDDGGGATIEDCPDTAMFCIADVGLKGTAPDEGGRPSNLYAQAYKGIKTNISSPKFDKILQALTELPPDALCDAYDVLIFNWGSPTIKNLNWQRLEEYMACGGGVIFEDQNNVGALATHVSTIEVDRHGGGQTPLSITLVPVPVLTDGFGYTASFVNQHIIFDTSAGLTPFLTLPEDNDRVVGLYGQFGIGQGRIVLTGPDNNYHGLLNSSNPEKQNHIDLLFNEINWVRNTICGDLILEPPLEECDDGNTTDGDDCSAVCIIE